MLGLSLFHVLPCFWASSRDLPIFSLRLRGVRFRGGKNRILELGVLRGCCTRDWGCRAEALCGQRRQRNEEFRVSRRPAEIQNSGAS